VPEVPCRCYRVTVIRNVVLVKLKPGQDPAEVADIQDEFRRLNCPGTLSYTIGSDLGLHDGNWSFAIVADFANAHAYRAYDRDSLHNRARTRLAPLVEQIARAQFEVPRDPFL
jgi:Stress responsive A/B Barrel Domain